MHIHIQGVPRLKVSTDPIDPQFCVMTFFSRTFLGTPRLYRVRRKQKPRRYPIKSRQPLSLEQRKLHENQIHCRKYEVADHRSNNSW